MTRTGGSEVVQPPAPGPEIAALEQTLLGHLTEIVGVVRADGTFGYVSASVTGILGWQPHEVVGRPVVGFLASERHLDFHEMFATVADLPGTHGPFGLNLLRTDGTTRLLQTMVTNRLDDPVINGLVTVARDETDRIAVELQNRRVEARFRAFVKYSSDLVVMVDPEGVVRYASPSVERILGYPNVATAGFTVFDLVHPDDLDMGREMLGVATEAPSGEAGPSVEVRLRTVDGSWRDLEIVATNLLADPDVGGIVFNGRDVTERLQAEKLVTEQATILEGIAIGLPLDLTVERILRLVEQHLPDVSASVAALDPDGVMRHRWAPSMAPSMVEAFDEAPPDGPLGRAVREPTPAIFDDIAGDPRWRDLGGATLAAGYRSCWCFPMMVPGGEDQVGMVTVLHREARGPTPAEIELLERSRNLAAIAVERRRFQGQLEHQAVHDVLTGLPNRLLLMDRVHQALARSKRHGVDVAVLFVDLDNFKVINDSLGHSVGDRLLEQVAERFRNAVHEDDTVGRFGGDEFVVVCEEVGGEAGAVAVADRLARSLDVPILIDGAEVHVSASIGITLASDGSVDAHSLIRDADAAMYRAKDQGRAGHAVFEAALHERVVRRLELERALRTALVEAHLEVHYQPVVRLADGVVVGAEALVRWNRPGHGIVEPDSFISVAEETGLVVPLDRWVLAEALQQLSTWRRAGLCTDLRMSVNFSARQLGDPLLASMVAAALEEAGLPGEALAVEITESALADDTDAALDSLSALGRLGVRSAIDDFGTGYASLDYLRRFAMADQLKIDRSFVADLDSGAPRDQAIVSASLVLARDLGFVSVAEGVETEAQRAVLVSLGCTLAQGFLFCGPLPAVEFAAWLAAYRPGEH